MPENEKPKLEKRFEGEVKVRKKSTARKLAEVFLSEDIPNVGDYLIFDLLVPAIKDTVVNLLTGGVEMLFYGKAAGRRRNGKNGTIVTYDQMYSNNSNRVIANRSVGRSIYDVMDVIFEDRGKAELVLDQMMEYIDRYKEATVYDFYDACGVTSANYNDRYWGWKDLRGAIVTRARGGWIINMPEPQQLK